MSRIKRRLTTVLCADVAGYTRLMEANETGTLDTLRRFRTAMAALVERHEGRVINTWGDAVLAEFSSVVEAVQCAVEVQQELLVENDRLPDAERMRFRIGINVGDVMVEDENIYGEGVNIAARLQELADPGGILISGTVYDQVHNKIPVGFDFLGQQQVKNVSNPVTSYRVTTGGEKAQAGGAGVAPPRQAAAVTDRAASPLPGRAGGSLGRLPEPAPPARRRPGDRRLPVPDQRLQRLPRGVVSLACGAAVAGGGVVVGDWAEGLRTIRSRERTKQFPGCLYFRGSIQSFLETLC